MQKRSLEAGEIAEHRPALLRYARLHLRDAAAAEDAVQEALVAALQAADSFNGESALQTWLISILRRKLVDHMRRGRREMAAADAGLDTAEGEESGFINRLFESNGHWATPPAAWTNPDAALEQAEFYAAFEECVRGLPERTAEAFVLREIGGLEAGEICKELAISASNYWVLMHRARLRLRECLQKRWFASHT
ncbi:MAG: sigma-70 family RNA polymerase sigma factor [Gammaproteobacteria bacterium]|nr:sigma-70 family RNA polymerase sigma factor [Gammaproteobacteria bacterium]